MLLICNLDLEAKRTNLFYPATIRPRSLEPFYIVSYFIRDFLDIRIETFLIYFKLLWNNLNVIQKYIYLKKNNGNPEPLGHLIRVPHTKIRARPAARARTRIGGRVKWFLAFQWTMLFFGSVGFWPVGSVTFLIGSGSYL